MIVLKGPSWWIFARSVFESLNWIQQANHDSADADLITSFKQGNESAFKIVFEQNVGKMYAFAFKILKSREQAEEIVHDAFLNAWNNRDKINASLPITPYIYTITKRLALNSLRQTASSQKAVDELWKQVDDSTNLTEEAILFNDLQRITETKVALLPAQQQQIFRMSREDGLSHDEIATKLNLSKNTVRNHLFLALKSLRQHLNEPYIVFLLGFLKNIEKFLIFFHFPLVHH
ncbi:RNA polymerase sigma-70 factor [uncultured Mucilaginibacter sp.]|uniref:RNA polymerase sigma factor n=1 Tax=uncultured Mucilaginibacter sp. TaxID=797541 RepID=UPI0025CE8204|nr:RNA polymerase sigma-70 factor [uncultured Mucilaginibacter sp.]